MRSKYVLIVLSIVAAIVAAAVVVSAGNPNTPPGPPETTSSYTLEHIYDRLSSGADGTPITFTEPISGPGSGTMHTLDDIMAIAPQVDDTNGAMVTQVMSGTTYWSLQSGTWGLQTGTAAEGGNVTGGDGQLTFTIPDGFYTGSKTATAQDTDLVAENIAQGVDLFGVVGSADVATGDATPADVLTGTTFSSGSGSGLSGTMPDNGAVTLTPTTTQQTIAAGYHNGSGYVAGDADLAAGNIRSGVTLFGVDGNPNVVNTASGDASPADILSGQIAWVDGAEVTGSMANNGAVTLTPTTTQQTIAAGYHNGSGYVAGDADLVAGNIRSGVTLFGVDGNPNVVNTSSGDAVAADILSGQVAWVDGAEVTGNRAPAPVPRTGQVISYTIGDDGDLEIGVAWPSPRFITGTTGIVTDTLTGLVWLENANCTVFFLGDSTGQNNRSWSNALTTANSLAGGYCGLTDGSSAGDWRLPNVRELQSLIDYSRYSPALPSDHPFTGVQWNDYWSSTTAAFPTNYAWYVNLGLGYVYGGGSSYGDKTNAYYVWPVRGGQ